MLLIIEHIRNKFLKDKEKEEAMTEQEIKIEKARIKVMPIFPNYTTNEIIEGNGRKKFTVTSSVRIHFEELWNVEVYLYPVEITDYVKRNIDKKELIQVHLYRCLMLSKYLVVRKETVENLPLLIILDKRAEDFTDKLWNCYA
jgi:hypothetical protein